MTWRGERRKQLPPDWARRRAIRLELDGYRCTATLIDPDQAGWHNIRCTAPATEVHHAFGRDRHDIPDLRSLCAHHHQLETQAEAQQARGAGPTRLRPKPKHPGLR